VPFVRPVTTVDVTGGDPVTVVTGCAAEPINGVTAYAVMGLPPFAGAFQDTLADESPGVAATPVGAPGTVAAGVTAFDWTEAGPVPTPLIADTVNV